jgi:hypothetical protein
MGLGMATSVMTEPLRHRCRAAGGRVFNFDVNITGWTASTPNSSFQDMWHTISRHAKLCIEC